MESYIMGLPGKHAGDLSDTGQPADPKAGGSSKPTADDPFAVEALDWFVRLQGASGDPGTSRTFRAWLDGDPRRAAAFEKVTEVWGAPEFLQATKNVANATGFVAPRQKSRRRSLAKKAAAVATAVVVAFALSQIPDLTLRLRADYVTVAGEQRVVTLPDGSRLTLNTESALLVIQSLAEAAGVTMTTLPGGIVVLR